MTIKYNFDEFLRSSKNAGFSEGEIERQKQLLTNVSDIFTSQNDDYFVGVALTYCFATSDKDIYLKYTIALCIRGQTLDLIGPVKKLLEEMRLDVRFEYNVEQVPLINMMNLNKIHDVYDLLSPWVTYDDRIDMAREKAKNSMSTADTPKLDLCRSFRYLEFDLTDGEVFDDEDFFKSRSRYWLDKLKEFTESETTQ